ncbi:MAG: glycoside hydrolase family 88 protein [Verrucomicrobiota bacterium]
MRAPVFALGAVLTLASLTISQGRDWYVHHRIGSDENEGSQRAPLQTAQAAVDRAESGDRIVLLPPKAIYRQSLTLNRGQSNLVIEGNGIVLTGTEPLPEEGWEMLEENLHRIRLPRTPLNRHLLIVNGKAERMGRTCQNPIAFPSSTDLAPGQFRWDDIDEQWGWLTYRGPIHNLEWSVRPNGFATAGRVSNLKVFDLHAKHFLNDGFNIHGDAQGIQCFDISGIENFDEGFSAHDTASCWVRGGVFLRNENAIADVNRAESYYTDCVFGESLRYEVLFRGGRHGLTNCRIQPSTSSYPLSIFPGAMPGNTSVAVPATLILNELAPIPAEARKWEVGPGCTVMADHASVAALSQLEREVHPSALFSEQLYKVFPIGRAEEGRPLMAWAGGSVIHPTPSNYRIIHFDRHSPDEVAAKIAPSNDWFGLMEPLPDEVVFPPQGDAFLPENSIAHALWRWIGQIAPDAVFVPNSPSGLALGQALQSHPPGEVGMVGVFVSTKKPSSGAVTSVLPKLNESIPPAKEEMVARLRRNPIEIASVLATHYGNHFSGSYIDALALIAKKELGIEVNLEELAKSGLDAPLPKNGGNISGTLLFAAINQDWATERLIAVADLAFDTDGSPLEAMPNHNEMSDAIFMAGPVLALAGSRTGESRYFDQCVRQVRFIQEKCLRPDGIYRHSPLSEAAWGRGNGFPALGIALILDHFPESHPERQFLEESLVAHLNALSAHQSREGMWHQLIDLPDSYAEFTATAMIGFAISRAIQHGLVPADAWEPRLVRSWEAIKSRVSTDGLTLTNSCTSTGKQDNLEAYYQRKAILGRDDRGGAMALLFASEMHRRVLPQ